MSVNLAPTFGAGFQSFLDNGAVNSNGFIQTYAAGSTTPLATYTTSSGSVQNGIPPAGIQLGVNGRPPYEIWLTAGSAYKFIITDQYGNLLTNGTFDNLVGIGDISTQEPFGIAQGGTGSTNGAGMTLPCGIAGGTANALTLTSVPSVSAYVFGQEFIFSALSNNTGATSVNINGIGVTYINNAGVACTGGEIIATNGYRLIGDGTGFELEPLNTGVVSHFVGLIMQAGVSGGTANAIILVLNAPWYAVAKKGQLIMFQAVSTNTGPTTISIVGQGGTIAATAVQYGNNALAGGEIVSGSWNQIFFDGTVWQLNRWQPLMNSSTTFTASGIYTSGFSDLGTLGGYTFQVCTFYKNAMDETILTGDWKGTGSVPFTVAKLPAGKGLYPYATITFPCPSNAGFGQMIVDTSGNLTMTVGSSASGSLDGMRWLANPAS
jgi:hypothetical protein